MRVAIIGAGLSGLSCALELLRHGIVPAVFEKKNSIGFETGLTAIHLRLFSRRRRDPILYIAKKYGLELKPMSVLKELTMDAPGAKTVIKGNLGYLFKRGEDPGSLENQIASKTYIPIYFDRIASLENIRDGFDFVVAASGDFSIAKELGVCNVSINTQTRVATVLGNFRIDSASIFFNTNFAKNSFCHLVPLNSRQAFLCLSIENISSHELDYYWKKLLTSVNFPFDIIQTADSEQDVGFSCPIRIGNILITGMPAGTTDSFLGFGALNSIESGFLAARAIAYGLDYESLMRPILKHVQTINRFRDLINTFDNSDYKRLIAFLGLPAVKQLIYRNPILRARDASFLAGLLVAIRKKH